MLVALHLLHQVTGASDDAYFDSIHEALESIKQTQYGRDATLQQANAFFTWVVVKIESSLVDRTMFMGVCWCCTREGVSRGASVQYVFHYYFDEMK